MIELIFSAIGLGILLSLVLIGPVFFLLIETSISKGPKAALALDLGVILADILCIAVVYYASTDVIEIIKNHPGIYRIGAFVILIYALYMLISKTRTHIAGENTIASTNYVRTFINGFLLNIVNIGVVVFWIIMIISIRARYPEDENFLIYITIAIITLFTVDLFKIYLARHFRKKMDQKVINFIRKIMGIILIIFSVELALESYGYGVTNSMDKLNKIENKKDAQQPNNSSQEPKKRR